MSLRIGGTQRKASKARKADSPRPVDRHHLLDLQEQAGNRAVTQLVLSRQVDAGLDKAGAEAQALMKRGVRLLKAHRYEEAVAAFREGFRTYPSSGFILNEASALLDGGYYAQAIEAYERYLADPEATRGDEVRKAIKRAEAGLHKEQSRDWFDRAQTALLAGRYEEALDAFERAYELHPFPQFKYNEGVCLEKLGRLYAAADRYEQYVRESPKAADAGKVKAYAEKLRAKADATPITVGGPEGGDEWMKRGVRLLKARRYEEAVAAFREGFRTYPSSRFILNEASALLDGGYYAQAIEAYERYLADPEATRGDEVREAIKRAREHLGKRERTAGER